MYNMENHREHFEGNIPAKVFRIGVLTIGRIVIALLVALILGWLVMLLWNWLMPILFGLKAVTYWEATGIIILAKLIFGGVGGNVRDHRFHFGHHHHHGWERLGKLHEGWNFSEDFGFPNRNWVHYREYWKARGKNDFEQYIRETGVSGDVQKEDKK
jgi:hypothetical protein